MKKIVHIDVCIASYQRPLMLSNLLHSLANQELDGISMRVIVIDNDCKKSAYPVVKAFQEKHAFEMTYDVEPQKNISLARNRALRHVKADYLAFVDDDEVVSKKWLRALLDSLIQYDADVAFGPVMSVLPIDAPPWAKKIFSRPHLRTGAPVLFGGAGNVMMKRQLLDDAKQHFNVQFGLTGGEDTEFFYRLHLMNKRLIWCEEAPIDELVPATRVTLKWLRMRGFRSGQNYNRIVISRYSFVKKMIWFFKKILQFFSGLALAPFLRFVSYSSYIALTVRIAATAGQLSHCFSEKNFEEYNT